MFNIYPQSILKNIGLRSTPSGVARVASPGYEPLGTSADSCVIYSKPLNKIVHLTPRQLGDIMTLAMNLGQTYLLSTTNVTSFIELGKYEAMAVGASIIAECQNLGPFDEIKVRGRGFWVAEDGTILANGTTLTDLNGAEYPRRNGNYIYESAGKLDYHNDTVAADENASRAIYDLVETFSFAEPSVAAHRFIGYLGTAYMPGVLPWRPAMMFQGPSGLGKSALGNLMTLVIGESLCQRFTASDSTVPGIRNAIGSNAISLQMDETEASDQTSKILSFNRSAAEGINGVKGSQTGGKSVAFGGKVSFMFGGIHPPKMEEADANRLVMVKMKAQNKKRTVPHFLFADNFNLEKKNELQRLGRGMCARMIRRANELLSTSYEIKAYMLTQKYTDRICDTYAPIVASAWIWLNDASMTPADMPDFLAKFAIEKTVDASSLAQNLLGTVLNSSVRTEHTTTTLHSIIRDYVISVFDNNKPYMKTTEMNLSIYGIKPELEIDTTAKELSKLVLLIKNRHNDNLLKLAPPESRQALDFDGVLMQQPGAIRESNPVRIGGIQHRVVRVPVDLMTYISPEEIKEFRLV